ncbi:MAG TPA: hypothetical protein VFZ34_18135, partial [Blastocatellia bacterium]|nr:hypothetical protein [Blastocatellia bacterium]
LSRLVHEEAGFDRALDYSDVSICIENLLGSSPKIRLSDWESVDVRERFSLNRQSAWNEGLAQQGDEAETISIFDKIGEGDPSKEVLNVDRLKHGDIKVFSLIDVPLWEKAGWKGTAYISFPDTNYPPYMALGFNSLDIGKEIFSQWREQLGKIDTEEQLRVSIITGINKSHPFSYKVMIGVNPKLKEGASSGLQFLVSRVNQMDPLDHTNLSRFLADYNRFGGYVLLPIPFPNGEPLWKCGIAKQQLSIRQAWQISENDPDVVALQQDDDPIIPDGIDNAPVLSAMKRWSKHLW